MENNTKQTAVTTFYSYKGGVGRSMALANVAWLLARNYGKRVLAVDWDLEAPGLHRFFGLDNGKIVRGLMDLLYDYKDMLRERADSLPADLVDLEKYLTPIRGFPSAGSITLLAAGSQDEKYASRVNGFNWAEFYSNWHGFGFIEHLLGKMRIQADIVLIDSRTGVTDIGGICTLQLPDVVVLLFALNEQSLSGAEYAIQSITTRSIEVAKRQNPPELILRPARVERAGNQDRKIEWEEAAARRLGPYLAEPERYEALRFMKKRGIPYIGDYSYGEVPLAVQKDPLGELAESFDELAQSVLRTAGLWTESLAARTEYQPERQASVGRVELLRTVWFGIMGGLLAFIPFAFGADPFRGSLPTSTTFTLLILGTLLCSAGAALTRWLLAEKHRDILKSRAAFSTIVLGLVMLFFFVVQALVILQVPRRYKEPINVLVGIGAPSACPQTVTEAECIQKLSLDADDIVESVHKAWGSREIQIARLLLFFSWLALNAAWGSVIGVFRSLWLAKSERHVLMPAVSA